MFVEASEVPPSFLLLLNSFKETPPRLGLVSVHVVGCTEKQTSKHRPRQLLGCWPGALAGVACAAARVGSCFGGDGSHLLLLPLHVGAPVQRGFASRVEVLLQAERAGEGDAAVGALLLWLGLLELLSPHAVGGIVAPHLV